MSGQFMWRGKLRGTAAPKRRRASVRPSLIGIGAGWIVVDFKPGETHAGVRVAYGPWRDPWQRDRAADAWRRDPLVESVQVVAIAPDGVKQCLVAYDVRAGGRK